MAEKPATKADLEHFREDLTGTDRRLAAGIVRNHERIDRLEESLSSQLTQRTSEILKAVDGVAAQVGKIDRHQIITDYRFNELDKRVKSLESPHP